MDVALYARVSTERQQQAQTIQVQLERLRPHVSQHTDWRLVEAHIYLDAGYSGAQLNRPGLDRLRDHAGLGQFSLVLITAPDRLARKYVHQVLLIEELQQCGCQVEFLDRPMSDDPNNQLLLQIRGAVAEYERSLIAERMRRGRQAKLKSGQMLPWSAPPYGYAVDPAAPRQPGGLRVDAIKAGIVTQIFAWYTDPQAPATLYTVTQRLNAQRIPTPGKSVRWNENSVRNILCNSAYAGMAHYGTTQQVPARQRKWALGPVGRGASQRPTPPEEWLPIPVPAIISPETFAAAQARMERNKQMASRHNITHEYLLRGLVSCARCQLACTARTVQPGYDCYACSGRCQPARTATGQRCSAPYVPASALDQIVWADICHLLSQPGSITHELARAQASEWLPQTLQARRHTLQTYLLNKAGAAPMPPGVGRGSPTSKPRNTEKIPANQPGATRTPATTLARGFPGRNHQPRRIRTQAARGCPNAKWVDPTIAPTRDASPATTGPGATGRRYRELLPALTTNFGTTRLCPAQTAG